MQPFHIIRSLETTYRSLPHKAYLSILKGLRNMVSQFEFVLVISSTLSKRLDLQVCKSHRQLQIRLHTSNLDVKFFYHAKILILWSYEPRLSKFITS